LAWTVKSDDAPVATTGWNSRPASGPNNNNNAGGFVGELHHPHHKNLRKSRSSAGLDQSQQLHNRRGHQSGEQQLNNSSNHHQSHQRQGAHGAHHQSQHHSSHKQHIHGNNNPAAQVNKENAGIAGGAAGKDAKAAPSLKLFNRTFADVNRSLGLGSDKAISEDTVKFNVRQQYRAFYLFLFEANTD
jgi:hypothetical protein